MKEGRMDTGEEDRVGKIGRKKGKMGMKDRIG